MTSFADVLDHQFSGLTSNEQYTFLSGIKKLHPGPSTLHIASADFGFPLVTFLKHEQIHVALDDSPRIELLGYRGHSSIMPCSPLNITLLLSATSQTKPSAVSPQLLLGIMRFRYRNTDFTVYKATWQKQEGSGILHVLVFDAPEDVVRQVKDAGKLVSVGHELIKAAYDWNESLKDEIWVFQGGCWLKDKSLWAAIQKSSWDELVLEQGFLDDLRRDTKTFFESHDVYKGIGTTWKRGLLLLGPPGNGKTETIKVLLKESGQAALYVKSFTTRMGDQAGVRSIFDHARAHAPCILVIEDLDSLVVPSVRSFFLNELDGLAQNEGILTIATTNHPEQIDDAILNRPSRFDVKYNFALPTEQLRQTYALKWLHKITTKPAQSTSATKVTITFKKEFEALAQEIAQGTGEWSFAFLKELFLSFLLRVAHDNSRAMSVGTVNCEPADAVLLDQITKLSTQIKKDPTPPGGIAKADNGYSNDYPLLGVSTSIHGSSLFGQSAKV